MSLEGMDFDYVRRLVYERSGIVVDATKHYLVEARLHSLARQEGFATLRDLVARLRSAEPGLDHKVVDSMTTNETFFFREPHAFKALRESVLPELLIRRAP